MNDFFGQELKIGDKVALTPHGYKNLVIGNVIGFTPQKVRISYMRQQTWRHSMEPTEILRNPTNIVKSPDHKI